MKTIGYREPTFQICAVVVLGIAAACGVVLWLGWYEVDRELWLCRLSGFGALGMLLVALSVTPIRRVWSWLVGRPAPGALVVFRRRAGISAAVLALLHAGITCLTYMRDSWGSILYWNFTRAGLAALIILVCLLVTSFPSAVRVLRINVWKQLHRLAYAAAFFVFLHLLFSPFASRWWTLLLLVVFVALLLLRLVPVRGLRPR